jgi:hypothetical protein
MRKAMEEKKQYPQGMKWTRQRKDVYDVLENASEPLSAVQIYNCIEKCHTEGNYAISTIYRILTAFEEHVRLHNQTAPVFPVSAVTGQGFEEAAKWLYSETEKWFSGGTDHE